MLGICVYSVGRKFPLTLPLFWDSMWLMNSWEKRTSRLACHCLFAFKSIHSSSLGTSFTPCLKQHSIAASKSRQNYTVLKMPAVREDLQVSTWATAATWLFLLGGENLGPCIRPVMLTACSPHFSFLLLLSHRCFCLDNTSGKIMDPQIHTGTCLSIFAWLLLEEFSSDLGIFMGFRGSDFKDVFFYVFFSFYIHICLSTYLSFSPSGSEYISEFFIW